MNRFRGPDAPTTDKRPRAGLKDPAHAPPMPRDLEGLKISHIVLRDLMLRHLRIHGVCSFSSLSEAMKISPHIIQTLFERLRKQLLIAVKGTNGLDYSFELTEAGRHLAAERSEICRYAGPAPVSLGEYFVAVKEQAARVKVNQSELRAALDDLVVGDGLLDQLGPALVSQRSLFLYGPTGNGKTSYSERLTRIYQDSVMVPYALEVDGQIITIFDPVVHHRCSGTSDDSGLDARWVVCERPSIIAGGELVSGMLDLRSDESSGTYVAPLQVKANNGILIIDDFGRQVISPLELLNRWMVPLDRRIDYLSLNYGMKFEVPFELLVVFSTNLDPTSLADEAFLRRIPNKVLIPDIDDKGFDLVFERETAKHGIACRQDTAGTLRQLCMEHGGGYLRACYPGDICRILHWISEYEERPIECSEDELERAVRLYFAQSQAPH